MVDYLSMYLANQESAIEISRLYGLKVKNHLHSIGEKEFSPHYCTARGCFQTVQICAICTDTLCTDVPVPMQENLALYREFWDIAETEILTNGGKRIMAKKKKKKGTAEEVLPKIKKKKKGTEVKPETKTKSKKGTAEVSNGDLQVIVKAVRDYFEPRFDSLAKHLQEMETRQGKTNDLLATYKPILSDMKKIVANLVGEEVTVSTKTKSENTQVERSGKKKEATEIKYNRKTALESMEEHLHNNDLVFDEKDAIKFVAKRIGQDASDLKADSIREYVVRHKKHKVPIEDLKVMEYHEDTYYYCACCFESDEEIVEAIEEHYYD